MCLGDLQLLRILELCLLGVHIEGSGFVSVNVGLRLSVYNSNLFHADLSSLVDVQEEIFAHQARLVGVILMLKKDT
jgi:hypothetical protein